MAFADRFRALPAKVQDEVLNEIACAIRWNGWDHSKTGIRFRGGHALDAIDAIKKIVSDHDGKEFEEYI